MTYFESVQELLEAKEGEHVQFKEAKIVLILVKQQSVAALWQTMVVAHWYLASRIKDPVKWSAVPPSTSQSAHAWV